MLNKHLFISFSKRTILFSLLVILMLLAFSENHSVKLQTNNNAKNKLEELNKAFYQIPAQKLHNFTINQDQTLFLATNLGLLTYDGQTWQNILAEETFAVKSVKNRLLASTRKGINISNDGGKSWYLSNNGLKNGLVALSIELTENSDLIYIGTDRHGIFRSNDGGASWQETNKGLPPSIGASPFEVIKRLSVSPSNSDLVFASTEANGVYFSKNAGETWQKANLNLPGDFPYRVDPAFISFEPTSNTIYALVNFPLHSHLLEHSIHKSVDDGNSWELVGKLPPNQTFFDFSVSGNMANIRSTKTLQNIDLIKLADEEKRKFLSSNSIPSNLIVIAGTEPDFEKEDIAILHDDGKFTDFLAGDLTGLGQEVGKRFYQRHGDEYDILVTFLDANYGFAFTGEAVAYNVPVQNQIRGIGKRVGSLNGGPLGYGSKARLSAFCNLGNINKFPLNLNESFFITNSTLDLLSHEVGHTWSAFLRFDDNGVTSDELLGRQLAHWSFFFNSNASELEGNSYQDIGNGQFRINGATSRYNDFDLYAMGLSSGAGSSFVISNPTAIDPKLTDGVSEIDITQKTARALPPLAPPDFDVLTLSGTRKNVSLANITKIEGTRFPERDAAPLRVGFVLLSPPGNEPDSETIAKLSNIRKTWLRQFASITNNRPVDASLPFRDGSDKVAPKITVKGPSGGDLVPSGAIITISWDSMDPGGIAKHDILLSLDGGKSYPFQVATLLNGQTQKFDFKIPEELFSNDVKIKVVAVDYAGNKSEDTNDTSFQIEKENTPPTIIVNKPNGGEQIIAGSPFLITWTSNDNGMLQSHDVNVSIDGGKTFRPIFSGVPGRTQSFLWQVPPDLLTTDARIQVIAKDSAGNSGSDISDKSFSIVQKDVTPPQVQLLSPLGGEKLQAGAAFNITWSTSDASSLASHELQLSTNSGQSYDSVIVSGLSGSARNFTWQVPNIETSTARIKIIAVDSQNNSSQDASTQNVIITRQDVTAPMVKVMAPNGGESLRAGENVMISWQSIDNVALKSQKVSLSLDGGNTFSTPVIDSLGANTFSLSFKFPDNIESSKARIKVEATDINNLTGQDISDKDFVIVGKDTIAPQVTVLSPNGSEVFASGDPLKVTWKVSDNVAVLSQDIQVSTDGGVSYTTLQSGLAGNIQEFTLDTRSLQSERAKIKIVARDSQNNMGSDDSDNVFALLAKPFISDVKYNNTNRKLMIFATTISANTEVTINGKVILANKKLQANKGALILRGSLSDLNLRSGDNILMIKERGLASGAFKLNLP
ncbi:MAG: hypothetical protein HY819_08505 [Acidobacteria bacterium]|nr:hypothetical protein [Acidobacteriota bacterium]